MKNTEKKNEAELNEMKKSTTRFLIGSLILLIIVCTGLFLSFALTMSHKSEKAINDVGDLYMHGVSERISEHFDTTIRLRLDQVETIAQNTPSDTFSSNPRAFEQLRDDGQFRDFGSLSFYGADGTFEMIYGSQVELVDPPPFLKSLKNGDRKVAVAHDSDGNGIVLLGIPAKYPMADGQTSIALVASVTTDYINQILALDSSDSLTYSHIIRRDGSYVIKNVDTDNNNYFERITDTFDTFEGKSAAQYVDELKEKMEESQPYSAIMFMENERRHLYCTHLTNSEWYLVTVMPYGSLDQTVSALSSQTLIYLFICLGIILLVLLIIFIMYFKMTQKQIHELAAARSEALSASKAKSEFLSNMSHDIRTPMNAIVGMTAIAIANIDNKQRVQNSLKKIALSSKHLLGLINDILDMSKIESGKLTLSLEQISLCEIVESIINIVQPQIKSKNQKFDVFIHDIENENVYCDSVRLNQILLNLLSNAIKFTPDGGSITLSMYEEPSPKGDNFVRMRLVVKDSGIGMTSEFKEKIFDSFTREDSKRVHKTEGSGLGMAITKYIVDAMEGTIEVDSELGKGTEFRVTLDMEQSFIHEEEMILPDWNMLVVDDDEMLCQSTVSSLKSIGVSADWTLDGETAIEMIQERHRKHTEYQIILMDWKLPGIDGIETARQIRNKLGDDVPIILISAYDWNDIEDEAREAGISGFIPKPLFRSTLYLGLKQFTGEASAKAEQTNAENTSFKNTRVLVAEDNELNWEIASELLSSELGLVMERAENGQICIDKFNQSPEGYYDAILMDIRMPVMTGYEATTAIRALDRSDSSIPIVAMTADAFSEDVKKCLDCGMNAHIAKPIDVNEISRVFDKLNINHHKNS